MYITAHDQFLSSEFPIPTFPNFPRTIIMQKYDPDLIPTQEFKILHALVTDPNASASNAVHQVLNLTTTELSSKNDMSRDQFESDVAWNIGVLTIDIAANTAPAQQTELLDFISQLQKVTVTDPRTGEMVKCGNFGYLWTDLPSLGMHAADTCNFFMDPCLSAALYYVFTR